MSGVITSGLSKPSSSAFSHSASGSSLAGTCGAGVGSCGGLTAYQSSSTLSNACCTAAKPPYSE